MSEVDLKLEIDPADIDRLLTSGLFEGAGDILDQLSTYLDTSDNALYGEGYTLQIRRVGDVRIQTVRSDNSSVSIFARNEWEIPITSDVPVIEHSSPLAREFGSRASEVEPKFDVVNQRQVWNVREGSSKIEIGLNRGNVGAIDRETPFCEIELELKDGVRSDLFILTRKIEAVVPIRFGVLSKAELGFRLLDAAELAVKSRDVEFDKNTSVVAAFQKIAAECIRHFRLNETILYTRYEPAALHQARVALRRLRSAISLFKPLLQDADAKRLSGELRWLAGLLGEARDFDVLLPKAKAGDLRDQLVAKRRSAYQDVIDALKSARTRALMLDFHEWLNCGAFLDNPATLELRASSAADFARGVLDQARKALKKHGNVLASLDDEHRHQARKDAKKLRYAAEFFRSLFDDKRGRRRHKRFLSAMKELQDELGLLNDLATGPNVLRNHGVDTLPDAPELLLHADKTLLIVNAQNALDDVLDAKRFWR